MIQIEHLIEWLRGFLKQPAQDGRTVLVSSHLMGEMSLTADHLIVIGRGRPLTDASLEPSITGITSRYASWVC